jgi:hypothetical protein
MVTVLFRCGHAHAIDPDRAVRCATCGEGRVARTLQAEPPRFTGHCTGPRARTVALGPMAVALAEQPLAIKES